MFRVQGDRVPCLGFKGLGLQRMSMRLLCTMQVFLPLDGSGFGWRAPRSV